MSVISLVSSGPLLLAIPVAAAAGAVTFLSPCCLPLVPGYLAYITGMSGADATAVPAELAAEGAVAGGEAGAARGAGAGGGAAAPPAAPRPHGRGHGAVRGGLLGRVLPHRPGRRRARPAVQRARLAADPRARRGDDRARAAVLRRVRPLHVRRPRLQAVRHAEGGAGGGAAPCGPPAAGGPVRHRLDAVHRPDADGRARAFPPVGYRRARRVPRLHLRSR